MVGRAYLQNGGEPSPAQDSPVWWTLHWLPWQRGTKKTLGTSHIDHHQWSTLATDHQAWCRTIHQVVSTFEDFHRDNLREKGHRWKIQGASTAIPDQTLNCSRRGQTCQICISLVSYQHTRIRHGQSPP